MAYRTPKVPFLQILEQEQISIDLLARFAQVSPWLVFRMASHRPVERTVAQRVLAEVSLLSNRNVSLETVEVAVYESGVIPNEDQEDVTTLGLHPTFRQLLDFHAITPQLLAEMTDIPLKPICRLAEDGVGEAEVIDSLLGAMAKLTGFGYMQHSITCTVLPSTGSMTLHEKVGAHEWTT